MACDVAKRRYKYVNAEIIDLTTGKSERPKRSRNTRRNKRRKIVLKHAVDEDPGSEDVNALFDDTPLKPVSTKLVATNLLN